MHRVGARCHRRERNLVPCDLGAVVALLIHPRALEVVLGPRGRHLNARIGDRQPRFEGAAKGAAAVGRVSVDISEANAKHRELTLDSTNRALHVREALGQVRNGGG